MKMIGSFFATILLFGLTSFSYAQFPDTIWTNTYGLIGYDYGRDIALAKDKGYIICGEFMDYYGANIQLYLIRIDEDGDTIWTRTYGDYWADHGYAVTCAGDSGFAAVGYTTPNGDNGFDVFVVRTDLTGDTLWTRHYGGSGNENGKAILQTDDGGFVFIGATSSYGNGQYDMYLVKIDPLGNQLWQRTYGGNDIDYGLDVKQTNDGGFILAGSCRSFTPPMNDMYLVKTDASGYAEWTQHYGYSNLEEAKAVVQTVDDGFLAVGRCMTYDSHEQIYMVKTDALGNQQWDLLYGGTDLDCAFDIIPNVAGNYVLTCATVSYQYQSREILLMVINDDGDIIGNWLFDYGTYEGGQSILESDYGEYVIAGYVTFQDENRFDVLAMKIEPLFTGILDDDEIIPADLSLQNYPNPFNASTTVSYSLPGEAEVSICIYNLLGQRVAILFEGTQQAGEHSISWDASGFPSGIYFARLDAGGNSQNVKMVLLK